MKTQLLALGLAVLPSAVLAHAHVERSDPPAGAVLHASPKAVRIAFSEPVMAAFSGAEIFDAKNRPVAADKAQVQGRRTLAVSLRARLAPGAYVVRWHAVSADTHRVEGKFGFSVAP